MNDSEFDSYRAGENGHGGPTVTTDSLQNLRNSIAYHKGKSAKDQADFLRRVNDTPRVTNKPKASSPDANDGLLESLGHAVIPWLAGPIFGFITAVTWHDHAPTWVVLASGVMCIGSFWALIDRFRR